MVRVLTFRTPVTEANNVCAFLKEQFSSVTPDTEVFFPSTVMVDADMVSAGFAGFIALVLLLITTGSKTKFSNVTTPAGLTPPAARNLTSDV